MVIRNVYGPTHKYLNDLYSIVFHVPFAYDDDEDHAHRIWQEGIAKTLNMLRAIEAERMYFKDPGSAKPDRDSVTALLTRGMFDNDFPKEIQVADECEHPLSLIMADIDHFKMVNDTHGHPKGDAVLKGVASVLIKVAERKGNSYRYGGEEMIITLPNHDMREATAVAERARRQIELTQIESVSVTVSFGVATYPDHAKTPADIVTAVDSALYDAKHAGRNLVRVCGEPPPETKVREPERKLPLPGAMTEQQKEKLRKEHFQGHSIRCPKDSAILSVEEVATIDSPTVCLMVWCKNCGLAEEL